MTRFGRRVIADARDRRSMRTGGDAVTALSYRARLVHLINEVGVNQWGGPEDWGNRREQAQDKLDALPTGEKDGWVQVPFPVASAADIEPVLSRANYNAPSLERIPLDAVVATQKTVTKTVVENYLDHPPQELERLPAGMYGAPRPTSVPIAIKGEDGKYYVGDGTHRVMAAWATGAEHVQAVVYPLHPERSLVSDVLSRLYFPQTFDFAEWNEAEHPRDDSGKFADGAKEDGGQPLREAEARGEPITEKALAVMRNAEHGQASTEVDEFMEAQGLSKENYEVGREALYQHNLASGPKSDARLQSLWDDDGPDGQALRAMSAWQEWQVARNPGQVKQRFEEAKASHLESLAADRRLGLETPDKYEDETDDAYATRRAHDDVESGSHEKWDHMLRRVEQKPESYRNLEGGKLSPTVERYKEYIAAKKRDELIFYRDGPLDKQAISTTTNPTGATSGNSSFTNDRWFTAQELKDQGYHLLSGARGLVGVTSGAEQEYIWFKPKQRSLSSRLRLLADWSEDQHPRDDRGRFSESGGSGKADGKALSIQQAPTYNRKAAAAVLGSTPPEEVVGSLLRSVPGDLTVRVGAGGGLRPQVSIKAESSDRSVLIERTIRNERGELVAHHDLFKLPKGAQGSGLAKSVLKDQVETYQKLGVTKVKTNANLDIGAYAWAKFGFTADEPRELAAALTDKLSGYVFKPWYNDMKSLIATHKNDPKLPWHIASTYDETGNIGKDLLRGVSWNGTLDLKDDAAMSRFQKYVGR